MIPLSPATEARIRKVFHPNEWEGVEAILLAECGDNLPMVRTDCAELAERIRFAALKLSQGNFVKLKTEAAEAAKDWRDVLMAAGFGESTIAHLDWLRD